MMTISEHHICVFNSRKGTIIKFQNSARLILEEVDLERNYLAWKQVKNIFMAVDRFNVMSYWNTLTGKLFYREKLEGENRIPEAYKYVCSKSQRRY